MILGFHCIFSMYGFWMPNDPRGSGSDYVAVWDLYRYGPATMTTSRRSVAAVQHDDEVRVAAKQSLRFPPAEISGKQAIQVVKGFEIACREGAYAVHACAVLPDHVHLVIDHHDRDIRRIIGHLKGRATNMLRGSELWELDRPLWGEHGWNVFLSDMAAMRRAIAYVENNPLKEGKKRQRWSFVTEYASSRRARGKPRG